MQITFNSYEEMMEFMGKISGGIPKTEEPKTTVVEAAVPVTPVMQQVQNVTPAVPTNTPVPVTPTVPVSQYEYTLDELASAAMQLMDKGEQVQLQSLLSGYGVEALSQLPKEQYGNFATALRGMGAQI